MVDCGELTYRLANSFYLLRLGEKMHCWRDVITYSATFQRSAI